MKLKIILFLLFFINVYCNAQSPIIEWQKSFGGTNDDVANCIQQTNDGGYIIAGYSASTNGDVTGQHGFSTDCWIVKLTSTGIIEWQKSLGGTSTEGANSIQQTSDGGYIVAGYCNSDDGDVTGNHGFTDYWIVKLSSTGVIIWQKSLGGTNDEYANQIQQTSDGGYIVAGYSYSDDVNVTGHHGTTSYADYWIVKLSSTGTIVWQKSLGGDEWDKASSIQQTSDGGYIVGGDSVSTNGDVTGNHGITDYWIVKLSSTGTIVWQKSLGGSYGEYVKQIQQTNDGGYIIVGFSDSLNGDVTGNHGLSDYWIVKLSSTGIIVWQKSFGGTNYDIANSIQQTSDGGYILTGYANSSNGNVLVNYGLNDYWILKITSTGSIEWQKSLGGSDIDFGNSIQQTSEGGYIVAGYSASTNGDVTGNHGSSDYWIIKLSSTLDTNLFIQNNNLTIFPNPTKDNLIIKIDYFTPYQEITITDLLGKIIYKQSLDGLSTSIKTSNFQKGVYFLNLTEGSNKITKKFIKE